MDGSSSLWINTLIIVFVLLLAILFTLSEYALVRTRRSSLVARLEEHPDSKAKATKLALHMVDNLSEYLSTAQVGITLTSLIIGWIGEETMADAILKTGLLGDLSSVQAHGIASVLAIILFTYIHAVFSDLVPKNIALDIPMKTTLFIARPLQFFHLLFFPLVWIMDRSSTGITKLLGFSSDGKEDAVSQVELLDMSKDSARAGEIDAENVDFLKRAFEMSEKTVSDVMIDRTSLTTVDIHDTIEDALNVYFQEQYSRLPVTAENDKDKILGYVYNYDLVRQSQINPQGPVAPIMRDLVAVPENMDVNDAMKEMSKKHVPMAVVVDEFGGTAGLVTDKDIYEELFGQFEDEQVDNDDQLIDKLGDHKFRVSGKTTLYDFEDYFKTDISEFEDEDAVTLTGYVLSHDPNFRAGDTTKISNFNVTALDYEDAYISEFEVEELPKEKDPNADNYKDLDEETK